MENLVFGAVLISLFLIFLQDLKERNVYLILLVVNMLCLGCLHYINAIPEVFFQHLYFNLITLAIVFSCLFTYIKFILKKKFKESIGLGDILFFMAIAVGFPTVSFFVLFSFSLLFSAILFVFLKQKLKTPLVPLAGFQALFLFLVLGLNFCFNLSNIYQF